MIRKRLGPGRVRFGFMLTVAFFFEAGSNICFAIACYLSHQYAIEFCLALVGLVNLFVAISFLRASNSARKDYYGA